MDHATSETMGGKPGFESFSGRRVMVTGGSGFIGAAVVRRLAAEGAEVFALSRHPIQDRHSAIHPVSLDVCDARALRRAFQDISPQFVFSLAGYSNAARGLEHVRPTLAANLVSTVELLALATEFGRPRVILAGSQEEPSPGDGAPGGYIPNSPYGASKFACSAYGRMFHAHYGLPVTIARMFTAYGAGQYALRKLLPYVILCFLRGEAPQLSSARRAVDWIYVDDLAEGLLALARSSAAIGQMVDLGTGFAFSGRDLVERLAAIMKTDLQPEFGVLEDRILENTVKADAAGTRAMVGWEAKVGIDEGLLRTVAWYREAVNRGVIDNSTSEPRVAGV